MTPVTLSSLFTAHPHRRACISFRMSIRTWMLAADDNIRPLLPGSHFYSVLAILAISKHRKSSRSSFILCIVLQVEEYSSRNINFPLHPDACSQPRLQTANKGRKKNLLGKASTQKYGRNSHLSIRAAFTLLKPTCNTHTHTHTHTQQYSFTWNNLLRICA